MYSVYLLRCSNDALYCGITNNLEARLVRHNKGLASKYTRSHLPVKLESVVHGFTRSDALKIEYRIKQTKRESKVKALKEIKQSWNKNHPDT